MCGINGIFAFAGDTRPDRAELLATREAMRARGPDGAGAWFSPNHGLALGHRRLSILDLAERSNQPMISSCGRFAVVFNGEIYNYPALRAELEADGCVLRTTSDTEVLLHLYARRGAQMVHALRGMFAFAIWDDAAGTLFLARDPYGIKPLYYACTGTTFRFASQVKALLAGGAIATEPDPAGVVGFFLWGHVPEPFTCYRAIRALPAGHTLLVTADGVGSPQLYASIASAFAEGAARPAPSTDIEHMIKAAVRDSAAAHLLADVEVGLFLSAGVDSGALLGLMRDVGQHRIRAITLAYDEFRGTPADEAPLAATVAQAYGADHIVRRVGRAEFEADLPLIFAAMDQPSVDGINVWFASKAAREVGLKVVLCGAGGDEILAGYASFVTIPRTVRLAGPLAAVPGLGQGARRIVRGLKLALDNPKLAGALEFGRSYPAAYLLRRGMHLPFELSDILAPDLIREGLAHLDPLARIAASLQPEPANPLSKVAALESANYLRAQLLRDADWAGMAHNIEVRTPLVDYTLLRAVASAVPSLTAGRGKRALAQAPSLPLPEAVVNRPKTGFGVPTRAWTTASTAQMPIGARLTSRHWSRTVFERAGPFADVGRKLP